MLELRPEYSAGTYHFLSCAHCLTWWTIIIPMTANCISFPSSSTVTQKNSQATTNQTSISVMWLLLLVLAPPKSLIMFTKDSQRLRKVYLNLATSRYGRRRYRKGKFGNWPMMTKIGKTKTTMKRKKRLTTHTLAKLIPHRHMLR